MTSYYTELDQDLGDIEQAERDLRELELLKREKPTTQKPVIETTKKPVKGAKVEVKCKYCGSKFIARVADRKRGWARFCSKSCKGFFQGKR